MSPLKNIAEEIRILKWNSSMLRNSIKNIGEEARLVFFDIYFFILHVCLSYTFL